MGFGRDQPLNPFGPGGYSRPARAPSLFWNRRFIKEEEEMDVSDGFVGAIGNTPLIRLRKMSEETGCEILGTAEFQNPGGSVKARAAGSDERRAGKECVRTWRTRGERV